MRRILAPRGAPGGGVLLCVVLWRSCAIACSPGFDNNVIPTSDQQLLSLPAADFDQELGRIVLQIREPGYGGRRPMVLSNDAALAAELADLGAALDSAKFKEPARDQLLERYRLIRVEPRGWRPRPRFTGFDGRRSCLGRATPPPYRIPGELPAEFNLYLRGARAYACRDLESA